MSEAFLPRKTCERYVGIVFLLILLSFSVSAQSSETAYNITEREPSGELLNSAIFYEKSTGNEFNNNDEMNEYSVTGSYEGLANAMQEANITYNQLRADITRDILDDYQPETLIFTDPHNLNREEIGLIYNWVIRDGGSIYVCSEKAGGQINRKNLDTLARLFNLQITPYILDDDENYIGGSTTTSNTTSNSTIPTTPESGLSNFTVDTDSIYLEGNTWELTEDVEEVSFYGTSGIKTTGNNKVVIEGNPSTYSRNRATFLPGSRPPVYVMSEVGRGKAVFSADCDMFTNSNIRNHDNGRLAKNTFEWLMSQNSVENAGGEKIFYEVSTLSRTISNLESKKKDVNTTISSLQSTRDSLERRISEGSDNSGGSAFILILNVLLLGGISGVLYEFRDNLNIPDTIQDALVKNSTSNSDEFELDEKTQSLEQELGLDQKTQQLEEELDL